MSDKTDKQKKVDEGIKRAVRHTQKLCEKHGIKFFTGSNKDAVKASVGKGLKNKIETADTKNVGKVKLNKN